MSIPEDLKYTHSHEWVRLDDEHTITLGITEHAQELLGDLVFVELPEIDQMVDQKGELCVVESSKTADDVYAPVAGKVIAINEKLESEPELVNNDPYGTGWLVQLHIDDPQALEELLDANGYKALVEEQQ